MGEGRFGEKLAMIGGELICWLKGRGGEGTACGLLGLFVMVVRIFGCCFVVCVIAGNWARYG